jgi:acyl-CoA reductase-like NAD-dependent aldehyde dehydrogenase
VTPVSGSSEAVWDLFIGGARHPGTRGERLSLLDPASNLSIGRVAVGGPDDAREALEVGEKAFRESGWAGDDGAKRARVLAKLAGLVERSSEELARLETLSMGKTLRESKGDIGFVVRTLEYVSGLADKIEGSTIPVPGPRFDYTLQEPLGVTVHIAPWNYPLVLAIRSVAPALAAGNAVVLKPASLTPLTALRFAELAKEAGLPDGILNVVTGPGGEVGEALVNDPRCRSVSFTGSSAVGVRIAELAARRMVPMNLELGGKSPVIVFPDADLDRAAKGIGFGIFGNAGQMCWAGSRLIVHSSVHDPLLEKLRAVAGAVRLGPGVNPDVDMGPLVSKAHLGTVLEFLDSARSEGATIASGGERPATPALAAGNFLSPTILTEVEPKMRVVREEIFGPVLSVMRFETADDAVRMANDTRYGLFSALWTKDLATAHTVASRLQAGMVTVNEAPASFPQTPFAGFKESGVGFEQGIDVVRAYTRRKNVMIHLGGGGKPKR